MGSLLSRHPAIRPRSPRAAQRPRRRRAALGHHAHGLLHRRRAVLALHEPRVSRVPADLAHRQDAPRGYDRVRIAREELAPAREDPRLRLAQKAQRQTHLRAHLAPAAQEQARRELPDRERGLHLGDHRAHVRRAPLGAQARAVRLRRGRLRDGAQALREISRGERHRAPHRRRRHRGARLRHRMRRSPSRTVPPRASIA